MMRLIVITPEHDIVDEHRIVSCLFEKGLKRLHLRKAGYSCEQYAEYIDEIETKYHSQIVVHGCFELYHDLGLGGIHLNTASRAAFEIQEGIPDIPYQHISTSYHSWQEINDNERLYGYVFISPVFDSISKLGYKAAIELSGARSTKESLAAKGNFCPAIFGLGGVGVGVGQLSALRKAGFDGAALLGSIWTAKDPLGAFEEAQQEISK